MYFKEYILAIFMVRLIMSTRAHAFGALGSLNLERKIVRFIELLLKSRLVLVGLEAVFTLENWT